MLIPLVVPQALRVRRTAPRFAAATGQDAGTAGPGSALPSLRLLAIGDSIVAGVGAGTTQYALAASTASALSRLTARQVVWHAQGKIGAGVATVREQILPSIDLPDINYVIVSVGVNDITSLQRSRRWAGGLGRLLDDLRIKFPHALIALAGIPPLEGFPLLPFPLSKVFGLRGRTFTALARREVAKRPNMMLIPLDFDPRPEKFSEDGFHPSQASYGEFGEVLARGLVGRSIPSATTSA